ncbi:MAG: hypothetical protein U9Q30_01480 [Campylobacterota bacterium]|nr:hypothetical protein [Campylobacterota bacterium]
MLYKIIFLAIITNSLSYANLMKDSTLYKEKQELMLIKDELNDFYEAKELDYQKSKAQLEILQKEIKKEEESARALRDENQRILDEMNRVITNKAMLMYDKMKLGVVINVFNDMIKNGKIDEVFDIIIRLKEKRVMKILKKLDPKTTTILMEKMRVLKDIDNSKSKEKK